MSLLLALEIGRAGLDPFAESQAYRGVLQPTGNVKHNITRQRSNRKSYGEWKH